MDTPPKNRRAARSARSGRVSLVVLIAGSVLALTATLGSVWLVRAGVVIAVAAAVVAVAFAFRQLSSARREHAGQVLETSKRHGAVLHDERTRNAAVVETLTSRVQKAGFVIAGQRITIAQLSSEMSSLNGDRAHLRSEIAHRDTVIGSLRDTVRSREAELAALLVDGDTEAADVHHLPRRMLAEQETVWRDVPAADELWGDGSYPTVVDLAMLETAMGQSVKKGDRQVG